MAWDDPSNFWWLKQSTEPYDTGGAFHAGMQTAIVHQQMAFQQKEFALQQQLRADALAARNRQIDAQIAHYNDIKQRADAVQSDMAQVGFWREGAPDPVLNTKEGQDALIAKKREIDYSKNIGHLTVADKKFKSDFAYDMAILANNNDPAYADIAKAVSGNELPDSETVGRVRLLAEKYKPKAGNVITSKNPITGESVVSVVTGPNTAHPLTQGRTDTEKLFTKSDIEMAQREINTSRSDLSKAINELNAETPGSKYYIAKKVTVDELTAKVEEAKRNYNALRSKLSAPAPAPIVPTADDSYRPGSMNPIPSPVGATTIGSKAEYDALPSGSTYINARDGKTYRKP